MFHSSWQCIYDSVLRLIARFRIFIVVTWNKSSDKIWSSGLTQFPPSHFLAILSAASKRTSSQDLDGRGSPKSRNFGTWHAQGRSLKSANSEPCWKLIWEPETRSKQTMSRSRLIEPNNFRISERQRFLVNIEMINRLQGWMKATIDCGPDEAVQFWW